MKHFSVKRNKDKNVSVENPNFARKMDISPIGLNTKHPDDQKRENDGKERVMLSKRKGKRVPKIPKFNEEKENFSTFNVELNVINTTRAKPRITNNGSIPFTSRTRNNTRRERKERNFQIREFPAVKNLGFDVQKIEKEKSLNNDLLDFSKNILQMMKSVKNDLSSLRSKKYFKRDSQFDYALKSARVARDKIECDYEVNLGDQEGPERYRI